MTRNLFLAPTQGAFDDDLIRLHIESKPDVYLDPHGTGTYVICGLPESVPHLYHKRLEDPAKFPYACLVRVTPERVQIDQEMADREELRSAMELMRWMWGQFEFSIREDGGVDLTERCRNEGVEALYPISIRDTPLPWEGRLIKAGFFQELDHGESDYFSLEECRADTPAPDEERIVSYLESGHLYIASPGIVEDMLADVPDVMIGPAHILTDGTYAWPNDLAYYVRTYHARLPTAFVIHMRNNGFQVPADVDVGSLKML